MLHLTKLVEGTPALHVLYHSGASSSPIFSTSPCYVILDRLLNTDISHGVLNSHLNTSLSLKLSVHATYPVSDSFPGI